MGYREMVIADGPVAYWRMGDTSGTTVVDEISALHNGARTGGARGNESPEVGWSMSAISLEGFPTSFDGVDDFVDIPAGVVLGPKYTIEFWIFPSYHHADASIHGVLGNSSGLSSVDAAPSTYIQAATRINHGFGDGSAYYGFVSELLAVRNFYWNHVAITFDKDVSPSHRVYVNGVEKFTSTVANGRTPATTDFRWLGRTSTGSFVRALLQEVAVYNKVLTQQQISQRYIVALQGSAPAANYQVQPIIVVASDSGPGSSYPAGRTEGYNEAAFRAAHDASWVRIQEWFSEVVGRTFNLASTIFIKDTITEAQVYAGLGNGTFVWPFYWMRLRARDVIDEDDRTKIYYVISPLHNVGPQNAMGADGITLNLPPNLPGVSSTHSAQARYFGGIVPTAQDAAEGYWASPTNKPWSPRGSVAHELAHQFGYTAYYGSFLADAVEPWVGGAPRTHWGRHNGGFHGFVKNANPNGVPSTGGDATDWSSITSAGYSNFDAGATLSQDEIDQYKRLPFFSSAPQLESGQIATDGATTGARIRYG